MCRGYGLILEDGDFREEEGSRSNEAGDSRNRAKHSSEASEKIYSGHLCHPGLRLKLVSMGTFIMGRT